MRAQTGAGGKPRTARRLLLAALGAALVSVAGGAAIYVIHATRPGATVEAPAASPRAPDPRAPTQVREPSRDAPGEAMPGSDPREAAQASSAQPVRPDPASADRNSAPSAGAAERESPTTRSSGAPREVGGSQRPPGPVTPPSTSRGSTPGSGPAATAATPQSAPAQAPVRAQEAPAARLADQQQAQCSEHSLLARLVCDERVRLRFCRGRWNEHPDCIVEAPRNTP